MSCSRTQHRDRFYHILHYKHTCSFKHTLAILYVLFTRYELLISIKTSFENSENSLFIWIHRMDEKKCISDLDLHCFQKRV